MLWKQGELIAPLLASATFSTGPFDAFSPVDIVGYVVTDQTGTINIYQGDTAPRLHLYKTIAVVAGVPLFINEPILARVAKVDLVNSTTPQTALDLAIYLKSWDSEEACK